MKKITFNVDEMLPILSMVGNVVASKAVIPILNDIIIKSYKDGTGRLWAMLSASDNEIWLSAKFALESGDDDFETAINAQDLAKAVKSLVGYAVTLSVSDDGTMATGKYDGGSFSVPTDNPNEFPKPVIGEDERVINSFDSKILLRAIEFVEMAIGNDPLRPIVNGIHIDYFPDMLVSAALDSSKFAQYTNAKVQHEGTNVYGFTMPQRASRIVAILMSRMFGDVKVSHSPYNVIVSAQDSFRLVARLAEGKYPPYKQLLSKETPIKATVGRNEILDALKRVMPMGNSSSESVQFIFTHNNLRIKADNIDFSKSAYTDVHCTYEGDEFKVNMKGTSVATAVSKLSDDNVIFNMSTPTSPVIITQNNNEADEELTYLVMPMLLQ